MIKNLLERIKSQGGRSTSGQITAPRRSSLSIRRIYRFVDFRRIGNSNQGTILRFDYDPNRNCKIALLSFTEGFLTYVIPAETNKIGSKLVNNSIQSNPGDSQLLNRVASGNLIYNLTVNASLPSQFVRSAGSSAILVKSNNKVSLIKLKSGEYRYFFSNSLAVLGKVIGVDYFLQDWKLAGKSRRNGFRPRSRALARNPVDHPMGGRTKGGTPKLTPKGKFCLNTSTKVVLNKLVVIKAREKKKL